jgi:carbonic anhydrase
MPDIRRLQNGFRAFRSAYFEARPEVYDGLTRHGQKPRFLIIACSDSRIDPAILFGAEPGELFVIRNIATLVPPYQPDGMCHGTSAAIESAVRDLKVEHIIVLGHSSCGGIAALRAIARDAHPERDFIGPWMALAAPEEEPADTGARALEHAAIRVSLANLHSFPWVAEAVETGELSLHGWWFDMGEGSLWSLDAATGSFQPLA